MKHFCVRYRVSQNLYTAYIFSSIYPHYNFKWLQALCLQNITAMTHLLLILNIIYFFANGTLRNFKSDLFRVILHVQFSARKYKHKWTHCLQGKCLHYDRAPWSWTKRICVAALLCGYWWHHSCQPLEWNDLLRQPPLAAVVCEAREMREATVFFAPLLIELYVLIASNKIPYFFRVVYNRFY